MRVSVVGFAAFDSRLRLMLETFFSIGLLGLQPAGGPPASAWRVWPLIGVSEQGTPPKRRARAKANSGLEQLTGQGPRQVSDGNATQALHRGHLICFRIRA
jgi:hypothetical protein